MTQHVQKKIMNIKHILMFKYKYNIKNWIVW